MEDENTKQQKTKSPNPQRVGEDANRQREESSRGGDLFLTAALSPVTKHKLL